MLYLNDMTHVMWCNVVIYFNSTKFSKKKYKILKWRTQDSQLFLLLLCFHCVIPWQLLVCTISFKITSIYINLSSQNLHSAIAALKQEAKPLTTLNIKDTKKGTWKAGRMWRHGDRQREKARERETGRRQ